MSTAPQTRTSRPAETAEARAERLAQRASDNARRVAERLGDARPVDRTEQALAGERGLAAIESVATAAFQELLDRAVAEAYARGYADGRDDARREQPVPFDTEGLDARHRPPFVVGGASLLVPGVGMMHRSDESTWPHFPKHVRVEANRALTDEEMQRLHYLIEYAYKANLGIDLTEGVKEPRCVADTSHSLTLAINTRASRRSVPAAALDQFESDLAAFVTEGTPERKTDRRGPAGTRKVEGLSDPGLRISVYYDAVVRD